MPRSPPPAPAGPSLWGPSFLVQTRGGHSDWIPRTTVSSMVHTFGKLVTATSSLQLVALVVVGAGAVLLVRADRRLGRVWICCVLVPCGLAALSGAFAPVLIDRTLTVAAWGPLLAIAFLVQGAARRSRVLATAAVVLVAVVMIPAGIHAVTVPSTPNVALRHLDRVVRPGDVVAIRPAVKQPELAWTVAVHADRTTTPARAGLANTAAFRIGRSATPATGRIWLLDWNRRPVLGTGLVAVRTDVDERHQPDPVPPACRAPGVPSVDPSKAGDYFDSASFLRIHATTSSASPAWFSAK